MKTGFIGCGRMGGGMARHLLAQDQVPLCFDPSLTVRAGLSADGLAVSVSAPDLAGAVELLILSLPNADIVTSVMDEIHAAIAPGTVVLDTSTSKPATSQQLADRAVRAGYTFLDGPVSGGPAAASTGTMTMLIGGSVVALDRVRPVLELLTARLVVVGGSGAGHAAKIANNLLCAANLVLVGEAVRLAATAGIDAEPLLEGVNAGSGRSGVSEVNYPRWVLSGAYDSGFTMGLMRKDVRLALELAEQSGLPMPGFAGIARQWTGSGSLIEDSADFNRIFSLPDLENGQQQQQQQQQQQGQGQRQENKQGQGHEREQ